MHIIESWLGAYDHVSVIVEGNPVIEGVRALPPASNPSLDCAYISPQYNAKGKEECDFVLISNRNDVIQVNTSEYEEVFNFLIEQFDQFRNLENRLTLAAQNPEAEELIAAICRSVLGPTIVVDQKYHIRALSAPLDENKRCSLWDDYERTRLITLGESSKPAVDDLYQDINSAMRNRVYHSSAFGPYEHCIANTYCNVDGDIAGQCFILLDRNVGIADIQMASMIMPFFELAGMAHDSLPGNFLSEAVFSGLIEQREQAKEDLANVFALQQWNDDWQFCVVVAEFGQGEQLSSARRIELLTNVQQNIYNRVPGVICIFIGEALVACHPVKPEYASNPRSYIEDHFLIYRFGGRICRGISFVYRDFAESYYYYHQAIAALEQSKARGSEYAYVFDCGLDLCLRTTDFELCKRTLHPLVANLAEYDRKHRSNLGGTLHRFLLNERSYVKTAKEMHLHRNTVVYRIEKIGELAPLVNLEDAYEREYLLHSFRLAGMTRA